MGADFDPTELSPLDHDLASAWLSAVAELGIRVSAPFDLAIGQATHRFGALISGFSTPSGLLLRAMPEGDGMTNKWPSLAETGFHGADVAPLLCRYGRDEFILFLNIFHWCGPPAERPCWHTGPADLGPGCFPHGCQG